MCHVAIGGVLTGGERKREREKQIQSMTQKDKNMADSGKRPERKKCLERTVCEFERVRDRETQQEHGHAQQRNPC